MERTNSLSYTGEFSFSSFFFFFRIATKVAFFELQPRLRKGLSMVKGLLRTNDHTRPRSHPARHMDNKIDDFRRKNASSLCYGRTSDSSNTALPWTFVGLHHYRAERVSSASFIEFSDNCTMNCRSGSGANRKY